MLVISFLSVALIFYTLGAPFIAALELITYAGAIMVLFLFAIMLLNLGPAALDQERAWQPFRAWLGPLLLGLVLIVELAVVIGLGHSRPAGVLSVEPQAVGTALFGPYLIGVELASILLLAGLIGAYYLGRPLDEPLTIGKGAEHESNPS
jgi:NADH-quinone oxidoreductase subunit J